MTTFIWVALKENAKRAKILWTVTESMFESGISAGAVEKLPEAKAPGKPDAETISSWSYDMEGHAKKCVERYCELATKKSSNCAKLQLHAFLTINSKKKNWDLLEN